MKKPLAKIGARSVLIFGLLAVIALGASLKDEAVGTTFAMDQLQLLIDSHAIYNGEVQPDQTWELKDLVPGVDKFFDFHDVMPGDTGQTVISFHVNKDAWACMDFTELTDLDNSSNEPESNEDPNGLAEGELSKGMEFFGWVDDGDNTYEAGEEVIFGDTNPQAAFDVLKEYILGDSTTGHFFEEDETEYVGILWCAGDLEVDTNTGDTSCDGSVLGNIAQSDSFSVDLGLRVVTAEDNEHFRCDGEPPEEGLELFFTKKFSGVTLGFTPDQFSFHVVGNGIDVVVPHDGSVFLPVGFYDITELQPEGFNGPDWRIQWSGDTCEGENIPDGPAWIEVEERDLRKVTSSCWADNQYRPENNPANQEDDEDDEEEDEEEELVSQDEDEEEETSPRRRSSRSSRR